MWSAECGAQSVECGVGSLKCRVWFAASPIDTARPQENQRPKTRHVGAAKRAFRARLLLILTLSTRYKTGWNVTKCHACHAKRHDSLLGNLRKGHVLQLPPVRHGEATGKPETRDETRRSSKSSISCETSSNFDTSLPQNRCFPLKICNLKIARGFRQFSSHLTKRHARHGICTLSPLDAALTMRFAKTRDTTRLKCCACHAK